MKYFVTGATGFIGRQLLPLLLQREGEIAVLVRPGSRHRFAALREELDAQGAAGTRLHAVIGDIGEPGLGIAEADRAALKGAQVFHLAAIYDLLADPDATERANILGTQNTVELANAIEATCIHHVSSIAVAGRHKGRFTEEMFDEGQPLDHPYFTTKYEAERIVRSNARVPFRVYRPGMVIGSSQTGEADRVDGPYYAFKLIQKLRDSFPQWMPFTGPEGGELNLVPVDFVARALDHIAHLPGRDGETFHLVDPKPLSLGDTLNTFCRAAHAPEFALRFDRRMAKLIPGNTLDVLGELPAIKRVKKQVLDKFGIPETALKYMDYPASFDAANATAALQGSGISVPPLHDYAWKVWDYWERHLDPELPTQRNLRRVLSDKVVLITGASSGIGRAVALRVAAAGATTICVARTVEKLEALQQEIANAGGVAHIYPTDLSEPEHCSGMVEKVLADHGRVDVLVNNAGRSIRRAVMHSLDRFHDFERTMKLNYFGAIACIMAVVPGMRDRGDGHIINVSSIGAQSYPPRFAAYVASKAALDAFSRCFQPEVAADGVAITEIHMPLVRTPMIAPTSIYDSFPTISPDEAADMVLQAIITRPHEVSTRLGKFGEVVNAVTPGLSQLLMTAAYSILPDSAGRSKDGGDGAAKERPPVSPEAYALSQLMRGIHL
ncbi:MAG TPA: SDR family oxidoreductase [Candidatus Dormibacteraeota bacterium]|nr:SDR family oxidoreductase [Candidatus Dormibacteraeota bacterium]